MTNALDDTPHHAREKVECLHRQYSSWLQLNLGRTYGAQDAEDIVQETWMRLVPVAAATTIRHPKALLLRIAANLARDLAASRRVRKAYAEARGFSQREEPCQEADLVAQELLTSLPAPLRDVFVLSRVVGLTNAQIGEQLGISSKTVEWRMTKALAHCAAQLRR